MFKDINNNGWMPYLLMAAQLILGYFRYVFLTGSVIFSLVFLLVIVLSVNPDISFGFLRYLSFMNPLYGNGSFTMGIEELMQIFFVTSFVLMIVLTPIEFAVKRILKREKLLTQKTRLIVCFASITSIYIVVSLIVAVRGYDSGLYIIFAFFYCINLVSTLGYILVEALIQRVSKIQSEKAI